MIESKNDKFSTTSGVAELNEATSPLEKFAKKVFDKLIEENIPPIPYYYKMYFLNMLDEEPLNFRQQVYEMISLEETNELEKDLEIEKKLKLSFKYSKELLQHTALLYKNSQSVKDIFQKYISETKSVANPKIFERMLKSLEEKLNLLNKKFDTELAQIKQIYAKNVEILKDIEGNSVFDSKYGLYNKKFFVREVTKETKLINKFKHKSSIIVLKIKDSVLNTLQSEKSKILINRSVAKIMLKTSRRTDTVAHLNEGIFAMLLKHTDRIGTGKTIERLADVISNSVIFLEGEEINIEISAGIVEIISNEDVEKLIVNAMNMMEKAEKDDVLYYIYEGE